MIDFNNGNIGKKLIDEIEKKAFQLDEIKIMEVCGTHTMEIGRMGLRSVLPKNIQLISGPGCPVCVTPADYIDQACNLCLNRNAHILSYGDMLRVPGVNTSLEKTRARGGLVTIITSPLKAIEMAKSNPNKNFVFLAVGFETTMPTTACAIEKAYSSNLANLSFYISHRLVPPALEIILCDKELKIDGFLLPGHVSAIIGKVAYEDIKKYKKPAVITGFKQLEILLGIFEVLNMMLNNKIDIFNAYSQVVKNNGNIKAIDLINKIFEPVDAYWRGIGIIPKSGMQLKENYKKLDAIQKYSIKEKHDISMPAKCLCGDVLKGKIFPNQCPLFGKDCLPNNPQGPCMVSSEGSCAAYYKFETGN
ncbi:hydrogenase formation protein HypD [bacterium B13(2017)]|nr:hydrogenase formation protein HypD [bacterium B13(2017)]